MSLIDKLFKKNIAGQASNNNEPTKDDPREKESMTGSSMLDQMFLKGFYSNESTFRNQAWRFPRFSLFFLKASMAPINPSVSSTRGRL